MNDIENTVKNESSGVRISRTPLFGRTYATNTFVSLTDSDIRIELLNEKFKNNDSWLYHSDHMVILTREAAKKLMLDLQKQISQYEEKNGEIEVSEDRTSMES